MSEWRTIDSAPRDGETCVVTGWEFNKPNGTRWMECAVFKDGDWYSSEGLLYWPTHWMPLPPAPTQEPNHE